MPNLFDRLIGTNDHSADSIVLAGLVATLALCLIQWWAVAVLHQEFSPIGFGTGTASILAGMGGGKMLRDKIGKPTTSGEAP